MIVPLVYVKKRVAELFKPTLLAKIMAKNFDENSVYFFPFSMKTARNFSSCQFVQKD